jgi:sterol desaturase/sphingolipid hydroxylase (fatty acid hydroxylase superfamily)
MLDDIKLITLISLISILLGYFFPIQKQVFKLKEMIHDFLILVVNEFCLSVGLAYISLKIVNSINMPSFSISLVGMNSYLQFISFLVLIDFGSYWVHRLAHTNSRLWSLHKFHHSIIFMNPLAAFRHSILWQIYNYILMGMIGNILSIAPDIQFIAILTTLSFDIFQHGNFKVPVPNFLNYIFILPRNHNFHHSKENFIEYGQNFGLVFSIWDIVFKTYYLPKYGEVEIGLKDEEFPKGSIQSYFYPIYLKKE